MSRLTEEEALVIGRQAMSQIGEYPRRLEMGEVPAEVFTRAPTSIYDGPLYASLVTRQDPSILAHLLRRAKECLEWEVSSDPPYERGGHTKVVIDDETGQILMGVVVFY
jgi:hypothetical protein